MRAALLSATPFCGDFVAVHLGQRQWEMSRVGRRSPVDQRCEQIQGKTLPLSSGKYQPWEGNAARKGRGGEESLASKLCPPSH